MSPTIYEDMSARNKEIEDKEMELAPFPEMSNDNMTGITGKKELLEEINKSSIPKDISRDFWHFTSNTLSNSFNDPKDKFVQRDILFITIENMLKQKGVNNVNPAFFQDAIQMVGHGDARFMQGQGTINERRTNLVSLLTKNIQQQSVDVIQRKNNKG